VATGRTPLITWIPNTGSGTAISLDDIINGLEDSYITTRAQAAGAVGQKFFLRWGHEMNGNWTNWNASKYGSNAAGAAKFAQAWQHIHDIFTSAGATNVLWVFSPNVNSVPVETWNTWQSYYPGDAYVDWMAFAGYNFGTGPDGYGWSSFAAITSGIYADLAATGKPIMIAEMSSSEEGGDKAAWISAMVPALENTFPAIKALVWFDGACEGGYTWCIDSSSTASAAFVTMSLDPYFNP
jgi:beta-mannanase